MLSRKRKIKLLITAENFPQAKKVLIFFGLKATVRKLVKIENLIFVILKPRSNPKGI